MLPLLRFPNIVAEALSACGSRRFANWCRHRTRGRKKWRACFPRACGVNGFRHHDAGGRSRAAAHRIRRTRRCAGGHADGRQRPRLSDRDGRCRGCRRRLHIPDYRAAERTFDLVAQVCGRSGRARRARRSCRPICRCTRPSCSPPRTTTMVSRAASLRSAETSGIRCFRAWSISALLGAAGKAANDAAERHAEVLRQANVGEVLGPAPYPIARVNNEWRFRVAIKTRTPRPLRAVIREASPLSRADHGTRIADTVPLAS